MIGLLVDGVSDILTIDLAQVQPTPEVASDMAKSFVRGVIPIDGRMVSLLALNTVLLTVDQHAA